MVISDLLIGNKNPWFDSRGTLTGHTVQFREKRLTQKAAFFNCGKCKRINVVRLVYADVKIFEKRICMKCHSLLNQLQKDPGN